MRTDYSKTEQLRILLKGISGYLIPFPIDHLLLPYGGVNLELRQHLFSLYYSMEGIQW